MTRIVFILALFVCTNSFSQTTLRTVFPRSAWTLQYAGSIGYLTLGYSKTTASRKMELGLLYGFVPRAVGGVNHSLNFKSTYNPFRISLIKKRFTLEPLHTGLIISQNFSDHLGLNWGSKYADGYYWWSRSLRIHVFAGAQVSVKLGEKHFTRMAYYFEVNTNDLYLHSYFPNTKTMSLTDILFFGMGVKFYTR